MADAPGLVRRDVLILLGSSVGAAALATVWMPRVPGEAGAAPAPGVLRGGAACVLRPEHTEGPYFRDERFERSDIRSDPSDGSTSPGLPLELVLGVARADGAGCLPVAGVLVDLWHCDAAGLYSDVQDPRFDTRGRKFLRGYQVTGADGTARFLTIYPGWYPGRAVHVHFKLRTNPDAASGYEFTSQLYFDDALTDTVHAQAPYARSGQRTRNAGDLIFADGGGQLTLALAERAGGGYAATFNAGIPASVVSVTTTTLAGIGCATVPACVASLRDALPTAAGAAGRRARRVARVLARRTRRLETMLALAAERSGARQTRLYARARAGLDRLLVACRGAAAQGTLGVELAGIEAAVTTLRDRLPA